MSQGLMIGLLLGSLLGVLIVTAIWIIAGGIKMRQNTGEDVNEQQAINSINQACEAIGSFITSTNPATINLVQFQTALSEKIAMVRSTVEANRESLEYYYLKYVERSIGDFELVVTRIDELLRSMGKGSVGQIGVQAASVRPQALQQQVQQQQNAFAASLDSAPTVMDIPLSAIMAQAAVQESPAMPELSTAPSAPAMPVQPVPVMQAPAAPVAAPASFVEPPPTARKAPAAIEPLPATPSNKEKAPVPPLRKSAPPVTPQPFMPDPSSLETRTMARPPDAKQPPKKPVNETVYFEMAETIAMPKDEEGIKLAEAFVFGGGVPTTAPASDASARKVDNAFALPQTPAPAKAKAEGGKKDGHDSSLITGDDLEQKLDSFFKL